ncbi:MULTISPECIES: DUF6177 family protein [unclassified Streptomyces]|uniref:DUF6177 family protein n=1 Tax=unclassified Streptomyces TaxID=2593676 RepID=UPI001653342E|nr:DUF6177 family protein [Streptomyces sp. sk2.1]
MQMEVLSPVACAPPAAVAIRSRPVVATTTRPTDVVRNAVRTGRESQIVTPPDTRLTR